LERYEFKLSNVAFSDDNIVKMKAEITAINKFETELKEEYYLVTVEFAKRPDFGLGEVDLVIKKKKCGGKKK